MEIKHSSCQWMGPEQDPRANKPIHFCGKPVVEGTSYCHEHYWNVYQKGTSINGRRRQKEIERELNYILEKERNYETE